MLQILKTLSNPSAVLLCLGLCFSQLSHAIEFRSIVPIKAVTLDAPSVEARKVYILNQGNPVEIIVDLGGWLKVRDQQGGLSWLQSKDLSTKRTVLLLVEAELKALPNNSSALVASVEKDVVLELLSPAINNGWIRVKHHDGVSGYIQSTQVWGVR